MTRKPVKQEHLSGCAVACVAYLLNITYKQALSLFEDGEEKAKLRGFYCPEVVEVLRENSIDCKNHYVKKRVLESFEKNSIIYLKKSPQYPAGHYLIYDGKSWMDPWINFPDLPIKAGFRNKLPGLPHYMIVPLLKR